MQSIYNTDVFFNRIKLKTAYLNPWQSMVNGNIWVWSIFHIVLGLLSTISPVFLIIWLYLILVNFIGGKIKNHLNSLPLFLGYIIPLEVLGRMAKATPFIPYEIGKYLSALLLIYGIYLVKNTPKGNAGKWILFLSLPGVFIGYSNPLINYEEIVANYLGLLNLSLAIIFFANLSLKKNEVINIFKVIFLISLSILSYVFIKSPDLDQVNYELGSNAQFSGGFGANQVSTVLGMAFGVTFFLWLLKYHIFPNNFLNLAMPVLFLGWALLSFSRGGVITAVISILFVIFLIPGSKNPLSPRKINIPLLILVLLIIGGGFWYVNKLTNNTLLLRYQGETEATLAGQKEKDIGHLTSGRWELIKSDISIWGDNIFFGVGVGMSKEVRHNYGIPIPTNPHTEVARLLSEHGFLGFIIALIFLINPIALFFKNRGHPFQQSLIIFCMCLAVITSFHSATRTFLTPFFYGLAFVHIPKLKDENIIYRK